MDSGLCACMTSPLATEPSLQKCVVLFSLKKETSFPSNILFKKKIIYLFVQKLDYLTNI